MTSLREISAVVQRDYEFPGKLVTVNGVEVTQDLKEAKVWVGVLGHGYAPQQERGDFLTLIENWTTELP